MVGPFARCSGMAMLEMLTEVICSEKLLCLIAFAMLVYDI